MTNTLNGLLLLQEVDALLADLEEVANREREEALGFTLGATKKLRLERDRLAMEVSPDVLGRYNLVRRRHACVVVPVRRGVCLGCFTVRPTKSAMPSGRLDICERCGRILFAAEGRPQPAAPSGHGTRARPKANGRKRKPA